MKFKLFTAGKLGVTLLYGCVSQDAYIGRFKLNKIRSKTLEIRDDGTYLLIPADPAFTQKGVYVKRDSTIEVTNALGFTSVMNITDFGLLEDNGDRWIRVTQK